ncbi:MAG TPA: protein kinase [Solirubrobacteraceae bacterium]|nr:protein kinase [Solirubrobacteraceae bacterium]
MTRTPLGTLLGGRYRLDAEIGRGGMSTVYRAFDTVLERPVAIKLMHREIATDSDQLERFRREARAVAQLNHPHIVTVIDAGEEPSAHDAEHAHEPEVGTPYIVLEYVDGETLKQLIRREGPSLQITQAVAYAIEIARALGAAHERLIVHRDVKPQNVLISSEGSAKITDFGIARTLTEEGLTMDGRVLGTTDYVSPEQALGQPVTGQSDLYSLGVVLYEMLTGAVPFSGETPVAVAMRHVREQVPDVQSRRPEVSAATAAVVEHATAADLAERYPDAASMVADLEEALALETSRSGQATGEVTSVLRTLPRRSRRRLPWRMRHPLRWVASLVALGAILALVLILAANHTHSGVPPNVPSKHGLQPVRLSQTAAHAYNPFGTGPEHPTQVSNVVDGDPTTTWSTEHYVEGTLAHKPGVGLYLDGAPGVVARAIEIQTPTPGFTAAIYASEDFHRLPYGDTTPLTQRGWTQLAPARTIAANTTIPLSDSGNIRYRYYLIWITALPPSSEVAEIEEATLFS